MASVDHKLGLLENIARLRRAQRGVAQDRDIAAVRAALERELGETVSRRLAARLLGVSHTALNRWAETGDLPLVYNANGHREVPVPALLSLHERITEERERGQRRSHVLEAVITEGRDRARSMRIGDLLGGSPALDQGHSAADRRSLAYHRAVARRLNRRMINEAAHRVWKWRDEGRLDPRYAEQWEGVLRQPVTEVRRVIGEDSPQGRDLRQNSPFAGMLSEPERRRIIEGVR